MRMAGYNTAMRIVVLGAGGSRKTEKSIVRAARSSGHACRLIDTVMLSRWGGHLGRRAAEYLVDSFEPEFLLLTRHAIELGDSIIRRIVHQRSAVFWYFDPKPKEKVLRLGRLVGRMCVTYLRQVELYRAAGIPDVTFMPQGVDPLRDVPASSAPPEFECESSFVGSGQYSYRFGFLRAVAAVSRLQIRGPGWSDAPSDLPIAGGPVHGTTLAQVIKGAAISLGASGHPEQDADRASASNRMWKILGCGGFYLGPYIADIETFAQDGVHCAWYRDSAQATELIRHYLKLPEERERIARAGRAHALAHHTYRHRLELLLAGKPYPIHTMV
jgi:Glycosyl transferases group 1